MKKLLILLLLPILAYTQSPCDEDICVVQFNAGWNSANDVGWFEEITDADLKWIDIATNSKAGTDHEITVVPTILILVDGEEEERYEADISFSMQATKKEIQEVIDEIVMDQF